MFRLKRKILQIIRTFLPQSLLYEIWHYRSKRVRRPTLDTASQHDVFQLQSGVTLETYWSDVPGVGRGPSASLFVLEEEVLRLDCFGGAEGHMHFNPEQAHLTAGRPSPRIYFQPASIPEQIDRAAFELIRNHRAAQASNMLSRVRRLQLKQNPLNQAVDAMTRQMRLLYQCHCDKQ